jgi:hypothetical protein
MHTGVDDRTFGPSLLLYAAICQLQIPNEGLVRFQELVQWSTFPDYGTIDMIHGHTGDLTIQSKSDMILK